MKQLNKKVVSPTRKGPGRGPAKYPIPQLKDYFLKTIGCELVLPEKFAARSFLSRQELAELTGTSVALWDRRAWDGTGPLFVTLA